MSVSIEFKDLVKKYGNNTIIPNLNLKVKDGEFFTLLGPSGCGKTTLLRSIIGFNTIEGGSISFNGKPIHEVPPSKRNIGMVFQNYAIFPHMTVAENVAFGLKTRKVPAREIKEKVDEILKIVKIDDLRDRYPDRMSGGQQQRVVLARAIVIHPDVLLMDEPLSNLDAKLRVEMRGAIREIQNDIGTTTIYVTHDQEEALAISDRIAVINKGVIQHVGAPKNIYQRPANLFVATFIGRSNIIDAKIQNEGGARVLRFSGEYTEAMDNFTEEAAVGTHVKVSVRPEEFIIAHSGAGIRGTIASSVFLGLNTHYFVDTEDGQKLEVIRESESDGMMPRGTKVLLRVKKEKINVYDSEGVANLLGGVENDAVKN
jgi:iron(III) transport system ATP-binding protein